jgi:hypothetical protein
MIGKEVCFRISGNIGRSTRDFGDRAKQHVLKLWKKKKRTRETATLGFFVFFLE